MSVASAGTTSDIYHSFLRLAIGKWRTARVSLFAEGGSGAITLTTAAAYGDEEADFNSPTTAVFPTGGATARSNDGVAWGTTFGTFDVTRQQVDLGVHVKNSSGAKKEMINVTLIVDVSE